MILTQHESFRSCTYEIHEMKKFGPNTAEKDNSNYNAGRHSVENFRQLFYGKRKHYLYDESVFHEGKGVCLSLKKNNPKEGIFLGMFSSKHDVSKTCFISTIHIQ